MKKHIIQEIESDYIDFSIYFDDDGLSEASGDYCNTLFIVPTRQSDGLNGEEYQNIVKQAEAILDGFHDVNDKWTNGYNSFETYKEVMEYCGIPYTSRKCHLLKEWAKTADISDTDSIAEFLTITTGKQWSTDSARGYSQGDYVEGVYCTEAYKDGIQNYLEIWLGRAKEFVVITLDDNGNEIDQCGGYIVAEGEACGPEDIKKLVCDWAGIEVEETDLKLIRGATYTTTYHYDTF